jgi:hypothetical protein
MRDSDTLRNVDSEEKETTNRDWLKGQPVREGFNQLTAKELLLPCAESEQARGERMD